jgi:hypothetical protein
MPTLFVPSLICKPLVAIIMRQTNILILLLTLLVSCNENNSIVVFDTSTPRQKTIRRNKLRNIYYVLRNSDNVYFKERNGDTTSIESYDSLGNMIDYKDLNFSGKRIRNYYDKYGYLKARRVSTDYGSYFYVSTFIDTIKLLLYQKWFDELTDFPNTLVYFNKRGQIDSCLSANYFQGFPASYKELFFYSNDLLVKTIKSIIDTSRALQQGDPFKESTEYIYRNGILEKIITTQTYQFNKIKKVTEYFDNKGIPVKKETILEGRSFLHIAKNNGY